MSIQAIALTGLIAASPALPAADDAARFSTTLSYLLQEGSRRQAIGGSELVFLGGDVLDAIVHWQVTKNDSGVPVLQAIVSWGYYGRKQVDFRSNPVDRLKYQWVRCGSLEGLRFQVTLSPKDVRVTLDTTSLPTVRKNWPKGAMFGSEDEPLPFAVALPALKRCLSDMCKELFQFSRPQVQWSTPEQFNWRIPVRDGAAGPNVGTLQVIAKLNQKGPRFRYSLTGRYYDKRGTRVNVGGVGTLEIGIKRHGDIQIPEYYSCQIRAAADGIPAKGVIRFHEKKLISRPPSATTAAKRE